MPETVTFIPTGYDEHITLRCATEKELLEFANKLRTAGGASLLSALLPSEKASANFCLIATACNFNCAVRPFLQRDSQHSNTWYLTFDSLIDPDVLLAISKVCGSTIQRKIFDDKEYAIQLPRLIGNAADAFDHGAAFQKYAL